ncbi:hypothetical protein VTO73DRAFT_11107 [Trametes versicolor]
MTTHDGLSACHKPMKDYAPDRATCASCALVCRWFYEPAGRVLWEELRDLSPLWSILRPLPPVELTKGRLRERIIPETYYNSILEEKPFLDPRLWQSVKQCASRVRELKSFKYANPPKPAEGNLWRALVGHNDDKTFLPSLRWLDYLHNPPNPSDLFALLAPPSLHTLQVTYCGWFYIGSDAYPEAYPVMENVVPLVAEQYPSLPALLITDWRGPASTFLPELLLCRNLRSLTTEESPSVKFAPIHIRTLLESLPRLAALKVHVEDFGKKQPPSAASIYAPTLRTLRCIGTCADLAGVAAMTRASALREVELQITDEKTMTLPELVECMQNATSARLSSSLRRLSITPYLPRKFRRMPLGRTRASWASGLRPSPTLLQLEQLELSLSPSLFAPSLTDDDALAIAQAMPRLRSLAIGSRHSLDVGMPSPRALLHFAKYCPDLEQLSLQWLEGTPIPDLGAVRLTTPPRAHGLRSLCLSADKSAVDAPDALAELLDYLFPRLTIQPNKLTSICTWGKTARRLVLLQRKRWEVVGVSGSPVVP